VSWKILTLDNDAFTDACRLLEAKVVESGFYPDMVVSIRSGGMFVGNKMFTDIRHRSTLLQRPSTAGKKRFVAAIVRNLPRFVQNSLRIVEARVLGRKKARRISGGDRPQIHIPFGPSERARKILVVDDAVDSGYTLSHVLDAFKAVLPVGAEVRSAVITVTTDDPLVMPDFYLYNDKTLVRFPWAMDA